MHKLWKIGFVSLLCVSVIVAADAGGVSEQQAVSEYEKLRKAQSDANNAQYETVRDLEERKYEQGRTRLSKSEAERLFRQNEQHRQKHEAMSIDMIRLLASVSGEVRESTMLALEEEISAHVLDMQSGEIQIRNAVTAKATERIDGYGRAALRVLSGESLTEQQIDKLLAATLPEEIGRHFTTYRMQHMFPESHRRNIGRAIVYRIVLDSGLPTEEYRQRLQIRL